MCSSDIFLGVLALLFPPIAVWVKCGVCSADSLINLLLCMLGLVPGLLHAWYIIAKYPEPTWEYETVAQAAHSGASGAYHNNQLYYDPERSGARPSNNQNAGVTYVFVRDDGSIANHAAAVAVAPHHDVPRASAKHCDNNQPQKGQKGQKNKQRAYGSTSNDGGVAGSSAAGNAQGVSAGSVVANSGSDNVPPSYAEAIGDHKMQRHE